jgi:quercetin dioxygenase-like cupin family protein
VSVVCACLGFVTRSPAGEDPFKGAGSIVVPLEQMAWRKQAPNLPQQLTTLWGDRDRDGGFGQLIELPPGFRSPLHAHSGDYHGVLIKGAWLHEDAAGKGTTVVPGSYVRQAGGEMHVDACVSKEPCLLFLFQYSRADVILAK